MNEEEILKLTLQNAEFCRANPHLFRPEIREPDLMTAREKLAIAHSHLVETIDLIHSLGLARSHFELYSNIADSRFHCAEAIYQIDNHPQPDA